MPNHQQMKRFLTLLALCLSLVQAVFSAPSKGDVLFQTDFEAANALGAWSGQAQLESGYQSAHSAAIERQTGPSRIISVRLPAEQMRGCTVLGSAMVKAENVSAKPNSWNGIKFMLAIESPARKLWPQAEIGTGSFDWQRAVFSARIPKDASGVTLILGLEAVTGKAWFDDVKIAVAKTPVVIAARTNSGPVFRGHNLPRLRGTMISSSIDAESLRVLGQDWNANLIRWQLTRSGRAGQSMSLDTYDRWLDSELKKLGAALPWCEKYGLRVVLDLHSPPGGKGTSGGYIGSDAGLFTDKAAQDKFVQVWRDMTRRFKGNKQIWGFDLANEPVETVVGENCEDWQALAERAARAIRAIDPDRTLIVEPAPWGGPEGLPDLVPLPLSNVVYSVHMYQPHAFTHQGVFSKGQEYRYPGMIEGKYWDKAQLEAALQPAIDFQKNYGVHIYIGEFSAIRWAPENSAYRYLKDLIEIFEAHGWDWSYHAFREWNGWSVEHGSDRQNNARASEPTDRQKLLCGWFARNQK